MQAVIFTCHRYDTETQQERVAVGSRAACRGTSNCTQAKATLIVCPISGHLVGGSLSPDNHGPDCNHSQTDC